MDTFLNNSLIKSLCSDICAQATCGCGKQYQYIWVCHASSCYCCESCDLCVGMPNLPGHVA